MIPGLRRFKYGFFLVSLLLCRAGGMAFSQTHTFLANENVYKHVTGGGALGTDYVIVDNLTDFSKFNPGDTVLVIQIKGVESRTDEGPLYGDPTQLVGSPGRYEFLIILSTVSGTRKIQFKNNLTKTYDPSGDVQIIRVPSYYNAVVGAGGLSCPPWDSTLKTGGVLTMIIGKTLTLNGDIDVSGKGFRGGAPVSGDGTCTDISTNNYSYNNSYTNSGLKGEGVVSWGGFDMVTYQPIFPFFAKGRGSNLTGGGAGNGKFSGGGGGGNIAMGGRGGLESNTCGNPATGGTGGKGISLTILDDNSRIFMGGGGGGSTSTTAGSGGYGGGIVLIICNEIAGNGHSIKADGADGGVASGVSGAGGGGAGGSVVIYLESFNAASTTLLTAKGGKGGNTLSQYGEGGGGAGGMVWTNIALPSNVTKSLVPGPRGTNGGTQNSQDGFTGYSYSNFVPVLNGFLFNTIRSSVTGNLTDSICSNNIPYQMLGTIPVGGSGNYTYLWQKRKYRLATWSSVASSNVQNYSFPANEADSFEIRRVVTDGVTALSDTSKQALVMVQPRIQNNVVNIYSHIISLTDTICNGQDPALIDQVLPDLFVPTTKSLYYYWQDSTQTASWGAILGSAKSYHPNPPGGLTKDTWYRRKVVSGRCADSTARVKFTVLPVITSNVVSAAQEICHGMTFANLSQAAGYTLGGGDNTYRYLWQASATGSAGSWSTATGTNTTAGYNPPESVTDTEVKTYYRRITFSGNNNVCADSSASLLLTEWKKISNNIINSTNQTICSGSVPVNIIANSPSDGNHTYSVEWIQKTASGVYVPAIGTNTLYNYQPNALTDTTWYRRYVTSSFCKDTSNMVVVNVHKPIVNNKILLPSAVNDSTICLNQQIPMINGTHPSGGTNNPADDIYLWQVSTPLNNSWSTASGTVNGMSYHTGILVNATAGPLMYYYRRSFTSGMCQTYSDTVTVKVLSKITGNTIAADQGVCYNTTPAALTGPGLSGGDPLLLTWKWQQSIDGGTTWNTAINTSNQQNYSPAALTVPTRYRRWIYSGLSNCCVDSSNVVSISINPLPVSVIAPATDTICEGTAKPFTVTISSSTASPWTLTYKETNLKSGTFAQTTLPPVSASSSTVNVTPSISSATLDSAAYSYSMVSVKDNNGCNATSMTGSRKLIVFNGVDNNSGFSAGIYKSICGPTVQLAGKRNFGTPFWTYDPAITPASPQTTDNVTVTVPLAATTPDVTYRFFWNVINGKCQGKDSVDLTFFQHPGPVSAQPDTPLFSFDGTYTLTSTPPTLGTGTWYSEQDGTIIPGGILSGLVSGNSYKYKWLVVNGACRDSVYTIVSVANYKIPNAFSPNNDQINDVFEIEGLDTLKTFITLTVFTTAGSMVYYTSNEPGSYVPWNGENNKGVPVPDGTYYYIMTLRSKENSKIQKFSGFVIVKRDKGSG